MFELASIKQIYYKKQQIDNTKTYQDYVLVDLFFRDKTWKNIKLYQSLGFQIKPIKNGQCLVLMDNVNLNEGQMIAFYLGNVSKLKFFINNVNILQELSNFLQVEIDIIDIIQSANTSSTNTLTAQRAINTQIATSVPATAAVINAQNPALLTAINNITTQNTNLDAKKVLLQAIKNKIDSTYFLEYE